MITYPGCVLARRTSNTHHTSALVALLRTHLEPARRSFQHNYRIPVPRSDSRTTAAGCRRVQSSKSPRPDRISARRRREKDAMPVTVARARSKTAAFAAAAGPAERRALFAHLRRHARRPTGVRDHLGRVRNRSQVVVIN